MDWTQLSTQTRTTSTREYVDKVSVKIYDKEEIDLTMHIAVCVYSSVDLHAYINLKGLRLNKPFPSFALKFCLNLKIKSIGRIFISIIPFRWRFLSDFN